MRASTPSSRRWNSRRAQRGRMERDDRGHRGEAHLEARPGERFGPEQQHDQRAGRDQPDAERIAAERDSGEDQQRRDAASHRRHLRAGQQGVADARRRRDRGRDQHQVEAQRQPSRSAPAACRVRNMAKATTAAMCRPLTDSRCVRPLRRIASASSWSTAFWSPVASAMAIPAGLGGSRAAIWRRSAVADAVEARGLRRHDHGHRAQRLADRADAA